MYKIIRLLDRYNPQEYYDKVNDGYVELVDGLGCGTIIIKSGSIVNDMIVIDCFAHYESDCYWVVCKHNCGQYCEIDIHDCGHTSKIYRPKDTKDSTQLSGGHLW